MSDDLLTRMPTENESARAIHEASGDYLTVDFADLPEQARQKFLRQARAVLTHSSATTHTKRGEEQAGDPEDLRTTWHAN